MYSLHILHTYFSPKNTVTDKICKEYIGKSTKELKKEDDLFSSTAFSKINYLNFFFKKMLWRNTVPFKVYILPYKKN